MVRAVGVPASGTVSARRCHHAFVHILVAESASVTDRACAREVEEVRRRRAFRSVETSENDAATSLQSRYCIYRSFTLRADTFCQTKLL